MEVITWIVATIAMTVAYAVTEIRRDNLRNKHYDVLHENIDLKEKVNALDAERELRSKYEKYLISQYEQVYKEKSRLKKENDRLREQVEFFERELLTEETEKEK